MGSGRTFSTPGTSESDLELASRDRLLDAKSLISTGRSAMAIANGLYALETRLKVLICQRLDITHLPRPFEIHDLEELLILTGLTRRLVEDSSTAIQRNWSNILSFSTKLNDLRYTPTERWPIQQAEEFMSWLDDAEHGVLTWLAIGR